MAEWCMAHPWMTFFLAALALLVIDSVLCTLFKSISNANKPHAVIASVIGMASGWYTQNIYLLLLNGFLFIGNLLLHKGGKGDG